jgi:hypothetical protein
MYSRWLSNMERTASYRPFVGVWRVNLDEILILIVAPQSAARVPAMWREEPASARSSARSAG